MTPGLAAPADVAAVPELFAEACAGNRRALARLLSFIERGDSAARAVGRLAWPLSGNAHTVGLTGAPGAGKSTLTSALIGAVRADGLETAVLAVDPSSPFSGGAILGDRVRMQEHALDEAVFIRSMASRGHLGGLSLATSEAIRLLDATGRPWVFVETVGVGQVEVAIASAADTSIVVVNPGWGDAVQASKAGLLEIADILVVNKGDRDGVEATVADLRQMLHLANRPAGAWEPPVVTTVATDGAGIGELWEAVQRHRAFLVDTGDLARRREARLEAELEEIVTRRLERRAREITTASGWQALRREVATGALDPWAAADEMLAPIGG